MLTIEELSILKIYCGTQRNRNRVMESLANSLRYIEEPEISELVKSVIRKVNAMTEDSFSVLQFPVTLD